MSAPFERPSFERPAQTLKLLFDLEQDPHERRDLSAARPELVARLENMVAAACESSVGSRQRARWQGGALETLKTLGYVQ